MEKYSGFTDIGTGIQPFLYPVKAQSSNPALLPLKAILFVLRWILVIATFVLLIVSNLVSKLLVLDPLIYGLDRFLNTILAQEISLRKTRREGGSVPTSPASSKKSPSVKAAVPKAKVSLIVANHSSYIDILYLTFRYNPVFLQVALDGKVLPYPSFIHALLDCGNPNPETLVRGQSLFSFIKSYKASYRPIAIFPEGTTSNGRGLLQFLPVFGDEDELLPDGTDLTILGLRFDWDNSVRNLAKKDIVFVDGPITTHNRSLTFNTSDGVIGSQISIMLSSALRLRKVGKSAEDKNQFLAFYNEREAKLSAKSKRSTGR